MNNYIRVLRSIIFIFLYEASVFSGFAQNAGGKAVIQVGENIQVSREMPNRALVEQQIAAHPKKPNHLLGAAIVASTPAPWAATQDCAAFVSFDGGKTWSNHQFGIHGCGDPWVTIGTDDTAYFVSLGANGLVAFRSTDGGNTWTDPPVSLGNGHDHPAVVVDTTAGKFAGTVYVISSRGQRSKENKLRWPVFFSRSLDNGKTFQEPVYVTPSNLNLNSDNAVILSDGTLVVPFIDFQRNVDEFKGAGMLERRRSWVIASDDGGQHFSPPLFVSEACGLGFASLAVDSSPGSFRNRLYFVCTNREQNEIYLNYSADRGEKWSNPAPVHQTQTDIMRKTPTVAVNKDGVVAVTWYDRVDPTRRCWELYFAASLDGGQTFLPEVRVSTTMSCPENPLNAGTAQRWPTGGDYSGLVATSDGLFHVFWSDSRTGIYQLWSAQVKVDARTGTNK
ncbi:MAG TPA: sialidase family protein [Blastocatellia bacterium]|nr:sialidase family protein [Blastocatellia bacterium]